MPLLKLFNRQGPCPPDGFRYVFPEDGYVVHAWAWNDWIPLAKAHLSANDRPIPPDLEDQMEHQLCSTLPPGWCMYDDPNRPRPTTSLTWSDVVNAVNTFTRWIHGGMKFVSQQEAERRAEICSRCYLNTTVSGCAACHAAIDSLLSGQSTRHDSHLKACAVCKCLLRAKVHFPISTLDKETSTVQNLYPEHCWLNKQSENYSGE